MAQWCKCVPCMYGTVHVSTFQKPSGKGTRTHLGGGEGPTPFSHHPAMPQCIPGTCTCRCFLPHAVWRYWEVVFPLHVTLGLFALSPIPQQTAYCLHVYMYMYMYMHVLLYQRVVLCIFHSLELDLMSSAPLLCCHWCVFVCVCVCVCVFVYVCALCVMFAVLLFLHTVHHDGFSTVFSSPSPNTV